MKSLCLAAALLSLGATTAWAVDNYTLGAESTNRAPGVLKGRVETFEFSESKVFPGTTRQGWIYIPAQYDGSKPAALMVFQDGHEYVRENGSQRVPIVLDNLIAKGEMPVTVAIFLNPGHRGAGAPAPNGWGDRNNRSFEYDSLSADYARFLVDEVIPFATARYSVRISDDPEMRGIAGMSSGGICAFTVAWERPDRFRKVLSQIGSFTNIRGGHAYPALIRKTERKPLRVFLQDGENDLNNLHGDWPLANRTMASALTFAGYDNRFVMGDGAHNGKHGGAILPDSLRWLWRPAMRPPAPSTNNWNGDEALNKVLAGGGTDAPWELVGDGFGFTDGACGDAEGNCYFSDLPKGLIYRVAAGATKAEPWLTNGPKVSGLKLGPDGQFYAATQGDAPKIVAIDPKTQALRDVATGVKPNDLIVSKAGWIYFTDTGAGQVQAVPIGAKALSRPRTVAGGITSPNGIALSPKQDFLYVSEYGGTNVWSFAIAADGSLTAGERSMTLVVPPGKKDSGGDGSTVDALGRLYVTSHAGVQMFDWSGRLGGVIAKPRPDKGVYSCVLRGCTAVSSPDRAAPTCTSAAAMPCIGARP